MDPRERSGDFQESLRAALDGRQASVWTALVCIVESFDPVAMTLVAQPAIQVYYRTPQGALTLITMPLLLDCPVLFQGGGGCTLTFGIKPGDECLVVFAARAIDSWWQNGGVQPPIEFRMHDLSDGFALVGVRSQPRRFTVRSDDAELRTDSGSTYVRMNAAGELLSFGSPNEIVVNAPGMKINGYLHTTANVVAGFGGGDKVGLQEHVHSGVQSGGSNTGAPVAE